MPTQPSREELLTRLYLIWFYQTYTNIPVDRPEGWMLPGRWPSEFDGSAPREYQPPYPAPLYWPKGPVQFAGEPLSLLGSGVRITGEFRALRQEAYWPTWEEFWGGTPQWPPPWPPVLPDGSIRESGIGGEELPLVAPVPRIGNSTMGGGFLEPPNPPGHEPLPPFPPGHEPLPPFPPGHELPPPPPFPPPKIPNIPIGPVKAQPSSIRVTFAPIGTDIRPVYEELCCIGFNPEESMLEAIIAIKSTWGYGGDICSRGGFESVGFWLIEPSWTFRPQLTRVPNGWRGNIAWYHTLAGGNAPAVRIFLGEARVRVYDIPRFIGQVTTMNVPGQPMGARTAQTGVLKYCVRLALPAGMAEYILECSKWYDSQSSGSRLPILHCVLGFNTVVGDNNYAMNNIFFGSMMDADIQFPRNGGPKGLIKVIERDDVAVDKVFPVHVAHLPNKKILLFSGSGNVYYYKYAGYSDSEYSATEGVKGTLEYTAGLFDPDTDTVEENIPVPKDPQKCDPNIDIGTYHDVFCAGHSVMPDGRVLVVGGTEFYKETDHLPHEDSTNRHSIHFPGLRNSTIFDPQTNTWINAACMKHGRWYPTTLVLGDGRILAMAGHTDFEDNRMISPVLEVHENTDLDIYNPLTRQWTNVELAMPKTGGDDPSSGIGTYPRIHLLTNGTVFNATQNLSYPPDYAPNINDTAIWIPPDINTPNQSGSWIRVNNGQYGLADHAYSSVLLPLTPENYSNPAIMVIPDNDAYICEPLSTEAQRRQWNSCSRFSPANGYSSKRRYYGNAIILPDMTVMLVGGINSTYPPKDVDGVLEIEFYNHFASNPRWSVIIEPKLKYPRNYHSNAILLYDGRVLICGSNVNATPDTDRTVDMKNRIMAFEIYTPEYLLKGIGPEFRILTARVKYGDRIIIELLNKWRWSDINSNKIVLIRLYSVTHAFANDQRCVFLKAVSTASSNNPPMLTDSTFAIRIPSDTDNPKGRYLLPPGPYMVFLSSNTGAVSKSTIIFIE